MPVWISAHWFDQVFHLGSVAVWGCSYRPHIQLNKHARSASWVPCNADEDKLPFWEDRYKEENTTSSD